MRHRLLLSLTAAVALLPVPMSPGASAQVTPDCAACEQWNRSHAPVRLHGNSYYVGTEGLGSILVTSPEGHVLIDGALPESAPKILENIRALGFRPADVKLILNSHAHYDHAGGIAALRAATGAAVAATASSAAVLKRGTPGRDDPQYGEPITYPPVDRVRVVRHGEVVRVGPLALTAHVTAGHTRGGTTWTWESCEGGRCLEMVYADSQTPVSADGFRFGRNRTYPDAVADFERGFRRLEGLRCDILVTPHPSASRLWERVAARDAGDAAALVDRGACARYAAGARAQLARRLATERAGK